ncbi:MAG TPA: GNAT family N-acetyltransferase [Blastocatellia bacterium]|nr:GNAT family N-acetyltransferase [Blastocatellia bacterium]
MQDEISRLEEQLGRALEGGAWHGPSVLEALEGVSAEQAAARPIAGAHSIWELVLHLCGTYGLVLRRLRGDGRQLTESEDWPSAPEPSAENWSDSIRALKQLNEDLRQAIRSFAGERLDQPLVPEAPYTAYTQFIGVTQHNLYHAGQIALLKKDSSSGCGVIMTKLPEKPAAHIEVIAAAPQQEPVLANLLELYAHDFSEFHNLELGADGRFGYKYLPLYWEEPDRHPYLVKLDGKLAGFVLVKRGSEVSGNEGVWDVAEFFIVRGYRRRGLGMKVAHEVWRRYPGRWEVRVMRANHSAKEFWERAITSFTGEMIPSVRVEKDGKRWYLFSFESCPTS